MTTAEFREILSQVTTGIEGRSLDSDLEAHLNSEFPADGPDSSHAPTVAGGNALVLYLLPYGAIEFSRS